MIEDTLEILKIQQVYNFTYIGVLALFNSNLHFGLYLAIRHQSQYRGATAL